MPEPTLEQFEAAYMATLERFNRHEFDAAFAGFPDSFEWRSFDGTSFGRGPAELAREFDEMVRDLSGWRVEPQKFEEIAAGRFLVRCHGTAVGSASGASPGIEWFQLWRFRDGLPVSVREYRTRDEALAAGAA